MKPRTAFLLAAALAIAGLAAVLYSRSPHSSEPPEIRATRLALLTDFRRATALEVCDMGDEHGPLPHPRVIAVIRRSDNPKRWERWVADLQKARAPGPLMARHGPGLPLHLIDGKDMVAEVAGLPYDSMLAAPQASGVWWDVQFESSLHDLLKPYVDREHTGRRQYLADFRTQHPRPDPRAARSPRFRGTLPPPARSFPEAKARLVKLFRDCDFVNLSPPGGGAPVKSGVAHAAWQQMTRAVESADRGWVVPGQPEVTIAAMVFRKGEMEQPVRLDFSRGQLACDDEPYYGSCAYALQAGPEFEQGLRRLQAAAKAFERQWDEDQRRRREYHKRTGKVLP